MRISGDRIGQEDADEGKEKRKKREDDTLGNTKSDGIIQREFKLMKIIMAETIDKQITELKFATLVRQVSKT